MATQLNSAYWELGSAVATAVPLTFGCWFNYIPVGSRTLISVMANTGNSNGFRMNLNAGTLQVTTVTNLSNLVSSSVNGFNTNRLGPWHYAAGVFSSATRRQAFLDGVPAVANTTNGTPAVTPNRTDIGAEWNTGGVLSIWDKGLLADAAIWGAALTPTEILMLSNGARPNQIRPNSLLLWAPFQGSQKDIARNNFLTNPGTLARFSVDEPPLFRRRISIDAAAVAAAIYAGNVVETSAASDVFAGVAGFGATLAESAGISDAFGVGAGGVSSAALAELASLADTFSSRIRTAARVPGAIGDCELTTLLPGTGIRVTLDDAIRVTIAGDIRVTMETAAALSGTSAAIPGAQDVCDLTVTVPGFDDDVTGYRVTMDGARRAAMSGNLRITLQ